MSSWTICSMSDPVSKMPFVTPNPKVKGKPFDGGKDTLDSQ